MTLDQKLNFVFSFRLHRYLYINKVHYPSISLTLDQYYEIAYFQKKIRNAKTCSIGSTGVVSIKKSLNNKATNIFPFNCFCKAPECRRHRGPTFLELIRKFKKLITDTSFDPTISQIHPTLNSNLNFNHRVEDGKTIGGCIASQWICCWAQISMLELSIALMTSLISVHNDFNSSYAFSRF